MKIYLAARYSRHVELFGYGQELEKLSWTITSRWIRGAHQIRDEQLDNPAHEELRLRFALEDWQDLLEADLCISFTEPPRAGPTRGGRHVEFGAAYALRKRCWIVGHRENIFHCLPGVKFFKTWEEALGWAELLVRVP